MNTVTGTQGEERSNYTKAESKAIRRRSTRLLLSLIKPQRRLVLLAAVVLVVSTALRVLGPALIAYGVSTALPAVLDDADWMPTYGVVAVYIASAIGAAVLVGWYSIISARLTQAILLDLRTRIFIHTQKLSLEFHEKYTSGRIISRQTSDLDAIRELLDGGLNELVSGVLYGVFTLIALFLVDWQSGVVLALLALPLFFLMRWFYQRSKVVYRESRVVSAAVIVKFVETMTGIRAVKAFRTEPRDSAEYGETAEEYRKVGMRSIRLFGIFEPGMMVIAATAIAVVVLWGGIRIIDGTLTAGLLLGAVIYVRNFFSPLHDIAFFLNSYQSAAAALEKVSGVLEETPTVADPEHPVDLWRSEGHIELRDVEFSYTPDRPILERMSLDVPAGQTIALVGTTGAGKSTLAKLIARFYDPVSGVVSLDGVSLRDLHPKDLRRAIVMVTQEAYLFSGSVAENIALGKPDATEAEVIAAAKAVGADEFISRLPDGYDTDVSKRGGRLSAGQRQLVSFARAFLAAPAVLILDEATASLDIPSERQIQSALQTLLADRTAIIIAHRLSTVSIADRVLVMEHGRVIEDNTPDALIQAGGKFADLYQAWATTNQTPN